MALQAGDAVSGETLYHCWCGWEGDELPDGKVVGGHQDKYVPERVCRKPVMARVPIVEGLRRQAKHWRTVAQLNAHR